MKQDQILSYYKRLIYKSSLPLLTFSLGLVTLLFFLFILKQDNERTLLNNEHKEVLAKQMIESLENTYLMIGKSSHSIIALKYEDYAGYRRVVLPWIQSDPRITSIILTDANGQVKIEWSKLDRKVSYANISESSKLVLLDNEIIYNLDINDNNEHLGKIQFHSDLKSSGLINLGIESVNNKSESCVPIKNLNSAVICANNNSKLKIVLLSIGYLFVLILIIYLILKALISNLGVRLKNPIQSLHIGLNEVQKGNFVDWSQLLPKDSQNIFMPLGEHFSKAANDYKNLKTKAILNEHMIQLAAQVSHDIRSPLAALKMLLTQLDSIPEDKRILIRSSVNRINDISNDLLNHGKMLSIDNTTVVSNLENAMLSTLVDSVVSEKRISLRDKANISLEARLDKSYGLFSLINSVEMKRLLSNTITNAAEAFNLNQGFVEVILESIGDKVILTIKDNGKGIPPHILEKLGLHGVTHGKEGTQSGSGLGVYHAKKTIESFGGKYEIKSKVGHGTSIIITLKKENPPDWFVQKLMITKNQTIIATDDDSSILEIWKQRFSGFIENNSIQLVTCTSGKCLKEWILNNKESSINAIYLMDFELLGQKQTGLDLIEELRLNQRAILVSSRYEESQIKDRCLKLGVKMIPKGMASLVPIELEKEKHKLDCVLIDDDIDIIHTVWKISAKEKIKIFCVLMTSLHF